MSEDKILRWDEERVIYQLSEAWHWFLELPEMHPQHKVEFMQAIHAAQRIVLARPALREINQINLPSMEDKEVS